MTRPNGTKLVKKFFVPKPAWISKISSSFWSLKKPGQKFEETIWSLIKSASFFWDRWDFLWLEKSPFSLILTRASKKIGINHAGWISHSGVGTAQFLQLNLTRISFFLSCLFSDKKTERAKVFAISRLINVNKIMSLQTMEPSAEQLRIASLVEDKSSNAELEQKIHKVIEFTGCTQDQVKYTRPGPFYRGWWDS